MALDGYRRRREGVIFWTLNQRASALEAGEWGMLDFQGRPSDRLTAASEVARTAKAHKSFFREARPYGAASRSFTTPNRSARSKRMRRCRTRPLRRAQGQRNHEIARGSL